MHSDSEHFHCRLVSDLIYFASRGTVPLEVQAGRFQPMIESWMGDKSRGNDPTFSHVTAHSGVGLPSAVKKRPRPLKYTILQTF